MRGNSIVMMEALEKLWTEASPAAHQPWSILALRPAPRPLRPAPPPLRRLDQVPKPSDFGGR